MLSVETQPIEHDQWSRVLEQETECVREGRERTRDWKPE